MLKKWSKLLKLKELNAKIDAMSVNAFEEAIKEYDVCLLGPQVRFQLEELRKTAQEYGKNIDAISPQAYGMMKGDEVLEQALELIN